MPLSALGISKRYKNNWALKDVSIELSAGRILGVCGPSGSGKSTLMRIFAGIEKEYSGKFSINGDSSTESLQAVLFSHTSAKSVSWLDRLFAKNSRGLTSPQSEAELVEINSPGVRIVLLDDLFCELGPAEQKERFKFIRETAVSRQNYTIAATSDFRDVLEFCDDCILLNGGAVVQSGTPEETYVSPVSAAAAAITGRANIFEARRVSSSKAENPQFQTIQGSHQLSIAKSDVSLLGPINQNAMLCIRPEHISISFGASFPEDNLLKAVIVDWRFLGPSTLVQLDSNGLRIEAFVKRLVGLKPGDECMISMPPDRISVLLK